MKEASDGGNQQSSMEALVQIFDPLPIELSRARAVMVRPDAAASRQEDRIVTLETLFRDHFDDVYRLVGRLLGPGAARADVEDLTQQAFLTAHKALPRYRGEAKPSTWMCGVAARTVMTQMRGWGRQRRMLEALEREPEAGPRGGDLEEHVERRRELHRVWRCLSRMSAKKRVVYILHEIEGMSGASIAEALEIPEATVWTRLYHARRELLRRLAREETVR